MSKSLKSERIDLRVPVIIREFLDFVATERGLGYAEFIRGALTETKEWAEWNRMRVARANRAAKAEAKAAADAAKAATPKKPTVFEITEHRKKMDKLNEYRDERGHYKVRQISPHRTDRISWHQYLHGIHVGTDYCGRIRDHDEHDNEVDRVLERRQLLYMDAGEEPPPLNPFYYAKLCKHGNRDGMCYDCDIESGEFVPREFNTNQTVD